MTAIADATTIVTILKGAAPTNAQLIKVAEIFSAEQLNPTNEQKAQAFLDGLKTDLRDKLRTIAKEKVYSAVIAQAHLPANQPALLSAADADALAAGEAAEGNLA